MDNLSNISVIKDVLARHNFTFSKALGQNFLVNPSVCPKIAEMGNAKKGFGIIEIGTGIGVLTNELAKRADKVVAIEIDDRLMPVLAETLAEYDNVKIINADVMETDLHKLIAEEFQGMDVAVCANLPYYITSPILMMLHKVCYCHGAERSRHTSLCPYGYKRYGSSHSGNKLFFCTETAFQRITRKLHALA